MFKKFVLLAMVFALLAGCATTQHNDEMRNSSLTAAEELANLPFTFAIIHGKYGDKKVFTPGESAEKYANLESIFTAPGFIAIIYSDLKRDDMDIKLEEIFKKEGYNLVESKLHIVSPDHSFWQMNFVKQGEKMIFID